MGLKGDIEETTEVWKGASWPFKIFLGLSFFLAVSSIASLADVVADWKGFLLTGVEFYREWFREPVYSWVSKLTILKYSEKGADIATINIIIASSVTRLYFVISRSSKYSYFGKSDVGLFIFSYALITLIIGLDRSESLVGILYWYMIFCYLVSVCSSFLLSSGSHGLSLKVFLLAPPIIVCIAAAINLGLRS